MNYRQLFFNHVAQTSPAPIGIEMVKADGVFLYDNSGKKYYDLISGFSVANIGHSNPKVIEAVKKQVDEYMHLIVYGEFIQHPQVAYAKLLADNLPQHLNCVYFVNSGAEATEGAMKLAKRVTGRTKMIAFNKSYHGSTQGALSVMGDEYFRNAFRPLLPEVYHVEFGSQEAIDAIDETVACVITEIVQAEAGVNTATKEWLQQLRTKCTQKRVLLIADEIQSGFGRTGKLWAFQNYSIEPDILLLGKALGGGMPLGAFIADKELMKTLTNNPVLGHITTFGGHPVSCAAGKAALEVLLQENWMQEIETKNKILREYLQHKAIVSQNNIGLWMAVEFDSFETNHAIIQKCIAKGIITDWFLFAPACMRIAPPLSIPIEQLKDVCKIMVECIEEVVS